MAAPKSQASKSNAIKPQTQSQIALRFSLLRKFYYKEIKNYYIPKRNFPALCRIDLILLLDMDVSGGTLSENAVRSGEYYS